MANDKDFTALLSWGYADPLPQEGLARVAAHPRAADASRALARNMLETRADALFKDGGHYVAAAWAAYLHGSNELTLPRLKEAGVASGLLSTGRTRDLLAYLLHLEYIERTEEAASGLPARYALTDTFSAIWRHHLGAALRAACLVEPAAALILDRLEQPHVFAAFARTQSGGLLEAATQLAPDHAASSCTGGPATRSSGSWWQTGPATFRRGSLSRFRSPPWPGASESRACTSGACWMTRSGRDWCP